MQLTLFQTLEDRDNPEEVESKGPFACKHENAWLGAGYYFWDADISVAHWWGRTVYGHERYMICLASAILDQTCWDLHGNESHRREFRQACEKIAKQRNVPVNQLKVANIIELLKRSESLIYKAIRALPINAEGYNLSGRSQNARLKFIQRSQYFLDLQPPVQICLVEKRALSLRNYNIVYPDFYDSPFV